MRLIETLKNIWKVEELRQRILTTLFFVLIYRLGSYIVIPGIDPKPAQRPAQADKRRSDGTP